MNLWIRLARWAARAGARSGLSRLCWAPPTGSTAKRKGKMKCPEYAFAAAVGVVVGAVNESVRDWR